MNAKPVPAETVAVAPEVMEKTRLPKRTLHGVETVQLAPMLSVVEFVLAATRSPACANIVMPDPPPPPLTD